MAGRGGVPAEAVHAVSERRRWLARCSARVAFRSPRSTASLLLGFAQAERNSELELLAAARCTDILAHRALYLQHALDESRHADAFHKRAQRPTPQPFPDVDIEDLFARLGERDFLAFVHLGERRGAAQFRGYVDHFSRSDRDDDDHGRLFAGILNDEDRHETTSWAMLVTCCAGDEALARRRLRAMAAWEAWRSWRRAGRALAGVLYTLTMSVLFVLCAPLSLWLRLTRPQPRGWDAPTTSKETTT